MEVCILRNINSKNIRICIFVKSKHEYYSSNGAKKPPKSDGGD